MWSTVPILITPEGPILGSTRVIEWLDKQNSKSHLLGRNDDEGRQIREWITLFDQELGPATRRVAYFFLFAHPPLDEQALYAGVGFGEKRLTKPLVPGLKRFMRKGLKINEEGVAKSRQRLEKVLDRVKAHLAMGRTHLVGERFTSADLTFASLAAPVLFCEPYGVPLPPFEQLPNEVRKELNLYRDSVPGRFALELYRKFRQSKIS